MFAWGIQLLLLLLLVMLKSLIAALAFTSVGYLLFEKQKLWDETRRPFERGMSHLNGGRTPQRAG